MAHWHWQDPQIFCSYAVYDLPEGEGAEPLLILRRGPCVSEDLVAVLGGQFSELFKHIPSFSFLRFKRPHFPPFGLHFHRQGLPLLQRIEALEC